jgi:hypothetical protein
MYLITTLKLQDKDEVGVNRRNSIKVAIGFYFDEPPRFDGLGAHSLAAGRCGRSSSAARRCSTLAGQPHTGRVKGQRQRWKSFN